MGSSQCRAIPDNSFSICLVYSKHLVSRSKRANASWFRIEIICPSGSTCLPLNCCFSESVLYKYTKRAGLEQNRHHHHHHHFIECNFFAPRCSWYIVRLTLYTNHPFTHLFIRITLSLVGLFRQFLIMTPNVFIYCMPNYTYSVLNYH